MSVAFWDSIKSVINIMYDTVEEQCEHLQLGEIELTEMAFQIEQILEDDIDALVKKDPATLRSREYVERAYNSILAVMYYRIAHYIYELQEEFDFDLKDEFDVDENSNEDYIVMQKQQYVTLARQLSETAKAKTRIEIHPAASIGRRFVIDHGVGTVIGETCVIGDNCYILQGVVLGALGIGNNKDGKRHPTLEDDVEIGAFSRVLGPITIGEKSIINPYCIVINDLPPKSKVSIINQLQISSTSSTMNRPLIYGVVPKKQGLQIIGKNLSLVQKVELIEYNYVMKSINNSLSLDNYNNCDFTIESDEEIRLTLFDKEKIVKESIKDLAIIFYYKTDNPVSYTIITNSQGVSDYVRNQIS